ncbi:MAG: hypothetical protein QOE36_766 [Gaiellaceae bacterium]|jgi:hypothetical protein|nr:hypothetical protein [Gaiellaceae bacterium]
MRRLLVLAAVAALAVVLGGARPATAKGPPSAVQQYTEEVPTGAGSHPVTAKGSKTGPISKPLRKIITKTAGKDAAALLNLTSKKQLGAPTRRNASSAPKPSALDAARASASPSAPSVAADTAGGSKLPWLVAALLALAVVALAPLALRGRRR